jgi:hypothetical protein
VVAIAPLLHRQSQNRSSARGRVLPDGLIVEDVRHALPPTEARDARNSGSAEAGIRSARDIAGYDAARSFDDPVPAEPVRRRHEPRQEMTDRPAERDELDQFLDPLLDFAQDMLRKHGEFYPFGATMSADGELTMAAGHTGTENPPSQEVIDLLPSTMRAQADAGHIRAAAICYDIRYRPDGGEATDAIAISLEHRAGDRAMVVQPYSKGRFSGWKFGDLAAIAPVPARVFVSTTQAGKATANSADG